ncbi:MAG: cytochrome c3 family protein [Candidatus Nitrospinota bacterium M3_3B_026]
MGKVAAFATPLMLLAWAGFAFADGWASNTKASNTGSIVNTRHNMTMSYIPGGWGNWMDYARNNYGEVCVYCHTPHGANSQIDAPLWNRTSPGNSYNLYNIPLTSGQSPTQPGVNSLTCLSCHDGTVAIDSIINMPTTQSTGYTGNYLAAQETSHNEAFLDAWTNQTGSGVDTEDHGKIWSSDSGPGSGPYNCNRCHYGGNPWDIPAFEIFTIGTDLRDDHPVGVELPDTNVYDFKAPTATDGTLQFFDLDGDSRADNNEVRFYDTGGGYEVECASCHDPHGVESAGPGSEFIPSFLRVNNNNASSLCLTCHDK